MGLIWNGDGECPDVSPWQFDSLYEYSGNTITLSTLNPKTGNSHYRLIFAGNGDAVYGMKDIEPPLMDNILEFSMFIHSALLGVYDETYFRFNLLSDSGGSTKLCWLILEYHESTESFGAGFYIHHNTGNVNIYNNEAGSDIELDKWHTIRIRYVIHSTEGGGEIWIDKVSKGASFIYATHFLDVIRVKCGPDFGSIIPGEGAIIDLDDAFLLDELPSSITVKSNKVVPVFF